MKNMKWLLAVMALFAIFAVIGCPTDPADPPPPAEPPKATSIEISGQAKVAVGFDYLFGAQVKGNAAFNKDPTKQGVTWEFVGAVDTDGTTDYTSNLKTTTLFDATAGELTVATDEKLGVIITIKATSTFNTKLSQTFSTTVRDPITIKFYNYRDPGDPTVTPPVAAENKEYIKEFVMKPGDSFANADVGLTSTGALDVTSNPRTDLKFNRFERSNGDGVTVDTVWGEDDEEVFGVWWSTVVNSTKAAEAFEKLALRNGSYAVYEFTIPTGKTMDDLLGLTVSYLADEGTVNSQVRNLRLMGPYIYSDFVTHVDRTDGAKVPYWGDFVIDSNGHYVAKYISGGTANDYARDKNGPYINSNINSANWANNWESAFGAGVIKANDWFTVDYNYNKTFFTNTTVANVFNTAHAPTAKDLKAGDKVYFGIGVPTGSDNRADEGMVHYVKDITLNFGAATTDKASAVIPTFGTAGAKQAFTGYITGNYQDNWRGAWNAAVVYPSSAGTSAPNMANLLDDSDGVFYVNLSDYKTVSTSEGGINATPVATTFTGTVNKGPLVATFAANQENQRLILGLLPDHITALLKAPASSKVKFTIDATFTGTDGAFRIHFGDPSLGGGWPGTTGKQANLSVFIDGDDEDDEGDPTGTTTQTITGGTANLLSYFILQVRHTAATPIVITIDSIKVEYETAPEVPPTPATEKLEFFKSTAVGGAVAPLINASPISGAWGNLTELNAAGPIVFPEGLEFRSYTKFTIRVNYYLNNGGSKGALIIPAKGQQWAQVHVGPSGATGVDLFNLGEEDAGDTDCTINAPITGVSKFNVLKELGSLSLNFQNRGAGSWVNKSGTDANGDPITGDIGFVELTEITFYVD